MVSLIWVRFSAEMWVSEIDVVIVVRICGIVKLHGDVSMVGVCEGDEWCVSAKNLGDPPPSLNPFQFPGATSLVYG